MDRPLPPNDTRFTNQPQACDRPELANSLDRLKFFLATAPQRWSQTQPAPAPFQHSAMRRFALPNGDFVSCIYWGGLYHITGTDIVRALLLRFEAFGRPVRNMKKFEEGVFSDLRNLKPGQDACLEEPKSPFLDLLFKYQCIRTQKKQKVFYWYSVPHDRLFLDALERDLKREKMGMEATTIVTAEPALSFQYDHKRSLYDQFGKQEALPAVLPPGPSIYQHLLISSSLPAPTTSRKRTLDQVDAEDSVSVLGRPQMLSRFAMFEGSPSYKQRRKKAPTANGASEPALANGLLQQQAQQQYQAASAPTYGIHPDVIYQHPPIVPSSVSAPSTYQHPLVAQFNPASPALTAHDIAGASPFAITQSPLQPSAPASAEGRKSFACPLFSCGRYFKRMEHLKRHLRTHTMEKPYQCDQCGKRFSRSDNLNQHLRTHGRPLPSGYAPLQQPYEGMSSDEEASMGYAPEFELAPGIPDEHLVRRQSDEKIFAYNPSPSWAPVPLGDSFVMQPTVPSQQSQSQEAWASQLASPAPVSAHGSPYTAYSDDSSSQADAYHTPATSVYPSPGCSPDRLARQEEIASQQQIFVPSQMSLAPRSVHSASPPGTPGYVTGYVPQPVQLPQYPPEQQYVAEQQQYVKHEQFEPYRMQQTTRFMADAQMAPNAGYALQPPSMTVPSHAGPATPYTVYSAPNTAACPSPEVFDPTLSMYPPVSEQVYV
ncbi:STE-domain-containing protein [Auricularia subglabra TFB-10046 SS5]|nr:STE-domain-containing protein [Auricularia subglabra TFB-10046 SS5]